VLSHVLLSKYHRLTLHHLLACVVSVLCMLLKALVTAPMAYSMLTSHPGYDDDIISHLRRGISQDSGLPWCHLRVPFCQARSDLRKQAVSHKFLTGSIWGFKCHTLYPSHFAQPTKLTCQCKSFSKK